MHGYNRPLEMKSNVIKRRKRLSASIPKSESDQLQNSPQPFENQGRRLHHPYPQEGRPLHVDPQRYGRALHPQDPKPSHPQNRPFPPGFARHPNAPSNVCIQRPRPIDAQSAHSQGYDSRPVYSQGYDPQDSTSVRSVPLDRMPPPARPSQPVRIQSSILTSPYPRHGYSASCPGTTMPYHAGYRSPDHSSDTTSSHVQERQSHVSSEYKIVELKEWPSVDKQDDIKEEEIYSGASEKYPNLPVYYQPQTQPITPVASPVRKDTPWEKASGAMSVMNLLN
jgi:hypothetical protein